MVDSGRNIYEIKFEAKFSGGISVKRLIISERRVVVEDVEEGDNRDAARSGTQTDRNCVYCYFRTEERKTIYLFKVRLVCIGHF